MIKCTLKYLQGCKTHAISNQININDENKLNKTEIILVNFNPLILIIKQS